MRQKIKTIPTKSSYSSYLDGVWIGLLVLFFIISGLVLSRRVHTEVGQFVPGETYTGENFSRSLDLRVAAKNSYPSAALSVVKTVDNLNGLSRKIISFQVPVDGLTEYGLMLLPGGPRPPHGYPTLVLCHGYANPKYYKTEQNYLSDMEFYASHGFAVIKPDYRGQGMSIHQGEADSGYYSMAYNTDVLSLISALKRTSYIDASQINLWGHSLGAYVALRAAVLSPDIKNLILLAGPVDNLSRMYLEYIPPSDENNLNALKTRQEVFIKYGPPTENTAFWKNASPITFISRINAHIQIHVGLLDQTVPPAFSADLDQALTKNKNKHDYFVYPDGNHALLDQRTVIWPRTISALQTQAAPFVPAI